MKIFSENSIPVLEKEKVILTGGTEGIGRAIAIELASQEHGVAICARTKERLNEMQDIKNIEAFQLDLGEIEKINNFIKESSNKLGGASILILNAAVSGITDSEEYTYRVDRDAQKALVESAVDFLKETNGRVVFITSSQAQEKIDENKAYGQSKKETQDWLRKFFDKNENKNIQFFSVNPGPVDTRMHSEAIQYGGEILKKRSERIKKEGKLRSPNIIGKIISIMSLTGKKFNAETMLYDTPISNNEIVVISQENIDYEESIHD